MAFHNTILNIGIVSDIYKLIEKCAEEDLYDFVKDILIRYKNLKRIYGYKMTDYWKNIATVEDYFNTNMDFLKPDIRNYFYELARIVSWLSTIQFSI